MDAAGGAEKVPGACRPQAGEANVSVCRGCGFRLSLLTTVVAMGYIQGQVPKIALQAGLRFTACSSTSVLLSIESILYPEFYCSLVPVQIDSILQSGGLL